MKEKQGEQPKTLQYLTQHQMDLLDCGCIRCYVCGKVVKLEDAVYLGKDTYRHKQHKQSTVTRKGGGNE